MTELFLKRENMFSDGDADNDGMILSYSWLNQENADSLIGEL